MYLFLNSVNFVLPCNDTCTIMHKSPVYTIVYQLFAFYIFLYIVRTKCTFKHDAAPMHKQLDVITTSAATPPPQFRSVLRLCSSVDGRLSVDACACGCNDFCWPVQLKMIEMNARRITLSFRPTIAHTSVHPLVQYYTCSALWCWLKTFGEYT